MKKRLRLKRKWVVIFTIVLTLLVQVGFKYAVNNYVEYLHECDARNGYSCNVFGK